MDDVFKALADPGRRKLLDALFREDGQTMTSLQAVLPMSRFGVMKHLQILEKAGLITSTKIGRERLHYLNPVPIQQVYDRWVSKYAGTFAGALTRLKYELEDESSMADATTHLYEVYIKTTPEPLWQALTDGSMTVQYYFGTRVEGITDVGGTYKYVGEGDFNLLSGTVLEVDPPRKLVTTFEPHWEETSHSSKVTYTITQEGEVCKLSLLHEGLTPGENISEGVRHGWAKIFSSLKSLLETGAPLPAGEM